MPYFEGVFIERIEHRIQVEAPNKEAACQYLKSGDALDNYEFQHGDYLDMDYDHTEAFGVNHVGEAVEYTPQFPEDIVRVNAEGKLIIPEEQIHKSVRVNEPRLMGGELPEEDE